jgi:hypothetical protein
MLFNKQDALLDNETPLVISKWQEANFNESPFSGYLCLLTLEQ